MKPLFCHALLPGLMTFAILQPEPALAEQDGQRFLGAWEYRQPNPAEPTGLDSEGERLEIVKKKGKLLAYYYGLERQGEEGLYYTAVEVKDLVIKEGAIHFVVPARHLFSKRPKNVQVALKKKNKDSVGTTNSELTMKGKIDQEKLVVVCQSSDDTCPAETLTFERLKR